MTRYFAEMVSLWLFVYAESEDEARTKAVEELRLKIKSEHFTVWEAPLAHYSERPVEGKEPRR